MKTHTQKQIKRICKKIGIKDYTINSHNSIKLNGNVNLFNNKVISLPLKFNHAPGNFLCLNNKLKSLVVNQKSFRI